MLVVVPRALLLLLPALPRTRRIELERRLHMLLLLLLRMMMVPKRIRRRANRRHRRQRPRRRLLLLLLRGRVDGGEVRGRGDGQRGEVERERRARGGAV
ncbi:hypothetical protein B0H34DRAFT_702893 [Crassisporium funariophilum]|nr:hypothetical protein B0H34DRAFT_702893 [Crassisporium funariophilum]